MALSLLAALATLDVDNNAHWTADGSPRVDVLQELTTDNSITRAVVNKAAPGFNRANPALELPSESPIPADIGSTGGPDLSDDQKAQGQPEENETGNDETEDTEDDEAALASAISDIEQAISVMEQQAAEAQRHLDDLNARRDALIEKREVRFHPRTDQENRMEFIRSQAAQRARRFGVSRQAAAVEDPRSQLDRAMSATRRKM